MRRGEFGRAGGVGGVYAAGLSTPRPVPSASPMLRLPSGSSTSSWLQVAGPQRPVPAGGVQGGEQGTVDDGDHRGSGASASTRGRRPSLGWRRSRSLREAQLLASRSPPQNTLAEHAKQPRCRAAARCSGSPRSGSRSSPPPPPPGPAPSTVRPPPAAPRAPAPPRQAGGRPREGGGRGKDPEDPEEEEPEGAPAGSHGASAPAPSPPFPPPGSLGPLAPPLGGRPAGVLPPRSGSGAPAPGAGAGAAATAGPAPVPSHPAPGPLSLGGPEARAARPRATWRAAEPQNPTACRGGG